ncbi:MAG TPA: alkaline phosphatase D family protein [Burkholderiales bacterium]|nr:alkaline phosphatase D family protein [Burkholderiales bacterium]
MLTRRRFLQASSALLAGCAVGAPRFASDPFKLGVASGYPAADGFVLWTRLIGVEGTPIRVRWEVLADNRKLVASGAAAAEAEWAHSVHVDVKGLEPDRPYWYRFTAGDAQSPVGRTRTAPLASASPARLRFAFASCQQYEQGYYGAYRHLVADDLDLAVFLGDYIYESSWGRDHVRKHDAPEPYTLADYRRRYELYKSDPDLQAAHAALPWIVTWDDHEVDNDYADDRPEDGMERAAFLERRAAAYRAYYEHLPLPSRMRPQGPNMRIYTQLGWGSLARFYLVDNRQYRSWHACPRPGRKGGSNTIDIRECPRLDAPGRSMMGRAQERWLDFAFRDSHAAWNVLAQSTTMARFDQLPGPGRRAWTDGWDGYPAARERLLRSVVDRQLRNPVVIGGDVHSFNVAELKLDFDAPSSPVVASEFVGTSITSQAWPQERLLRYLPDNPHIVFAESTYRGYTRVDVTPTRLTADLRAMDSVQTRDAACRTLASFAVEDGRPGAQRA